MLSFDLHSQVVPLSSWGLRKGSSLFKKFRELDRLTHGWLCPPTSTPDFFALLLDSETRAQVTVRISKKSSFFMPTRRLISVTLSADAPHPIPESPEAFGVL
jgi:hypothetical protein